MTWGNEFLETLLDHYGTATENGKGPWVDPVKCREEIVPFKRVMNTHKLSENRPEPHQFNRATEVFPKIFSGRNSHNKEEFQGKCDDWVSVILSHFPSFSITPMSQSDKSHYGLCSYAFFSALYRLMATSLCVMVGNAEAERVFSLQNRIKTQLRNQLSIERLDKLMRIKYHGKVTDGHLQAAAEKFLAKRNRRI